MKIIKILIILILISDLLVAGKVYDEILVVGEVISVYDGDTFRCNLPNMISLMGDNIPIRLSGIQAPEMRAERLCEKSAALQARDRLESILRSCSEIKLRFIQRDKYFRINAVVFADTINVNDLLVEEGLAVPYDEKSSKPRWFCQD